MKTYSAPFKFTGSNMPDSAPAPMHGFMLDVARCQESRAYYERFIDFASARGMTVLLWHFTDDQGCSLELDAVPGIASPNAYSKTEMRELIAYARERGIEIVPELASLGHCRYLTRLPAYRHLNETDAHFTGMCPVSGDTRRVVRAMIEEVVEIFDSPNFHVGLDEVNIGEHPLTRAALQIHTRGELLADYAVFLHGILAAKGRRMWMWGDGVLKHPEMLARIPKDTVICDWQYMPDASPETTQTLLDAGFDVMLCSALISHDQPLFPGDQFAVPNVRVLQSHATLAGKGRVLGHINTIWTPVRFIADSLWLGIDLAAAIMRDGANVDADACIRNFAETFHGLRDDDATVFAEVGRLLFDESPMRKDWLTVAKLEPMSPALRARVAELAVRWGRAHQSLSRMAPAVREHAAEYRAFMLLIEVLASTHETAHCVADQATSASTLKFLAQRTAELIDRVDANWDRERFADDFRKYTAPIASFQNDHLIPVLQVGLDALRAKQAAMQSAASNRLGLTVVKPAAVSAAVLR